ncbi:MAG: CIA30 family protein, partial [Planctomycetota bacterium]|nr:CIA30 family protein [Planctomycetota bacterium]
MKLISIPTILALAFLFLSTAQAEEKIIANFDDIKGPPWRSVNDRVMGGLSKGEPSVNNGVLTFKGVISLKNNGGFSSARTAKKVIDLSAYDGLALRIKPDGRKYRLTIESKKTPRYFQLQYWAELKVKPGVWQTIQVPFSKFYPTTFGRRLPRPKLDRKSINAIGFMLYDKKEGSFEIKVDSISAYNGKAPKTTAGTTPSNTIVDLAVKAGTFKTLLAAAKAAGLAELLSGDKPLTVFAPTDAAFAKLPKGLVATLLLARNKDALIRVLTHHVVPGRVDAATALKASAAKSAAGTQLKFNLSSGRLQVNGVKITATDLPASNGFIHV